jgi:hypothetical protein
MNKHSIRISFGRLSSSALGSLFALTLLSSAPAAAAEQASPAVHASAPAGTRTDHGGWSFNATPVLIVPKDGHRWGGGLDPELKYTLDLGRARLSGGGRVGGYYAKNQFGVTLMPTVRLMVPLGAIEPYVAGGVGYGWLPKTDHADLTTMARAGFVYRFSKSVAIGLEGTLQELRDSTFRFISIGSMMAFDL